MSTTPNNGGPAFPRAAFSPEGWHAGAAEGGFANTKQDGMSLRQFYAALIAQALQGRLCHSPKAVAKEAFEQADALIAFEENERR